MTSQHLAAGIPAGPKIGIHQAQFQRLLEALPVAAYTCDREGLITFFNRHAETLWGRAPKLFDPVDRFCGSWRLFSLEGVPVSHDACWMALALENGQDYNAQEIVIERPDGSRVTASAHASPFRDESSNVIGAVNLLLDITDRARADDAQALLAAIVESSDDAIVSGSLDGKITSWNRGAERIFGYRADEVIGRPLAIVIPDELQAEENLNLERLKRGEPIGSYETTRVNKQGIRIDVSLTVSPIRDRTGRIIGASRVARDITNRKRTERALHESEERFRTLADNIAQLAWMAEPTGSIVWYNQRWFDYTGTTLKEMQGWGWQKVHDPEHVDRVVKKIRACFESGDVWEDTFPLRGKDGTYRWFLSRAVPIRDEAGNVLRWFGTNTDITAQLESEGALREADRLKDEFLAMLAHELRNPLAPISNSLHILRLAGDVEPAVERVREIMERQTNHLVRLVDDLLDVSRITRGKIELRPERVEVAAVIRSAVETSRPVIDANDHRLAISLPAEPLMIVADPIRLAQVVANVLNNAAKYTPMGGQIWLGASAQGGEAVICVRDNGVGIPAELLPRIFEKFTQGGDAKSRPHGGLGIGLALARSLVNLHGGRIEAHSAGRDEGSEFKIHLPLAASKKSRARTNPHQAGTGGALPRQRILIVDDARDSTFILAKLLEVLGQEVFTANNGFKALEIARLERPDIVISDIGMADMDGYELAQRLRKEPELNDIYLVALTGYGQDSDRQRAEEAGFDRHLVKPVDLNSLKELLSDVRVGSSIE